MLDSIEYKNKSIVARGADFLLTPCRYLLNGRTAVLLNGTLKESYPQKKWWKTVFAIVAVIPSLLLGSPLKFLVVRFSSQYKEAKWQLEKKPAAEKVIKTFEDLAKCLISISVANKNGLKVLEEIAKANEIAKAIQGQKHVDTVEACLNAIASNHWESKLNDDLKKMSDVFAHPKKGQEFEDFAKWLHQFSPSPEMLEEIALDYAIQSITSPTLLTTAFSQFAMNMGKMTQNKLSSHPLFALCKEAEFQYNCSPQGLREKLQKQTEAFENSKIELIAVLDTACSAFTIPKTTYTHIYNNLHNGIKILENASEKKDELAKAFGAEWKTLIAQCSQIARKSNKKKKSNLKTFIQERLPNYNDPKYNNREHMHGLMSILAQWQMPAVTDTVFETCAAMIKIKLKLEACK